jgi:sulfonate transport system ATP-binding protein
VEDNIRFGLEVKKVARDQVEGRTNEMLDLVGLKEFRKYYPRQLSASMDQRVVIARAFAINPDLMLMDEPYCQLDVKLRYYLEDEIIRIWRELKRTVIFVTHNIEEAVYVAERILVLTPKPTTIKAEIKVDLPRPRNFADPEFVRIREEVTEMIKWW